MRPAVRWPLAALITAALLTPPPVAGQSPAELVTAFTAAWTSGNGAALERMLADSGLRIGLDGVVHSGVGRRQAGTSVLEFLGRHEPGRLRPLRLEISDVVPPRGFAEFEWTTVSRGASETLSYVVFLGLQRAGDTWRIGEIRILR